MKTILILCSLSAQLLAQDPRIVFSTYQGGNRNDDARDAVVDAQGNLYITGETESLNLAAEPVGGQPLTAAVFKAYLTKLAPNGKSVLWRKLIGGASNTVPHALALDAAGNIYVAGTTGARDLPLVKPVQDKQTGLNIAFLMKFNPEGKLLFSTYFGGERNEEGLALAIDSSDNVYLAGRASSENLPVKNAPQPKMAGGGQDGFIAKYTPDNQLAWATYFGGTAGTDNIYALAIGPDDSLYVTGDTMSPGLATPGAWQTRTQSYSAFAAKLDPAGAVTWFTYLGFAGATTTARALAIDSQGRAHVGGHTTARQMPVTAGAIQPSFGGGFRDGFLLRLSADGAQAEVLTYLGGSTRGATDPDETVAALKIDSHGLVYAAGETSSPDFPGRRVIQPTHAGGQDSYLLRLDLDASQIIYSTFWGGAQRDAGFALALGPGEAVTVVGESFSDDLPVANAVQPKIAGANDAFVAQFCEPWLTASGDVAFAHVRGGALPPAQSVTVFSGCPQPFSVSEVNVDQPWLRVTAGARLPLDLKLEALATELEPGEYKAVIRVTAPDAFYRTLEIPVTLTVADPPTLE